MKRQNRKLQAVIWTAGEDLPLFTGSPVPVIDRPAPAQPATPTDPATWDWACTMDTLLRELQP